MSHHLVLKIKQIFQRILSALKAPCQNFLKLMRTPKYEIIKIHNHVGYSILILKTVIANSKLLETNRRLFR